MYRKKAHTYIHTCIVIKIYSILYVWVRTRPYINTNMENTRWKKTPIEKKVEYQIIVTSSFDWQNANTHNDLIGHIKHVFLLLLILPLLRVEFFHFVLLKLILTYALYTWHVSILQNAWSQKNQYINRNLRKKSARSPT